MAVKLANHMAINLISLETYLVSWLLVDLISFLYLNSMASTYIKTVDREKLYPGAIDIVL
jgi:hypothetical protein